MRADYLITTVEGLLVGYGALTAGSVGPTANAIAVRWLEWWGFPLSSVDVGGSVVFVVGLCGMTVCDAVIRWVQRWRDGPPSFPHPPM